MILVKAVLEIVIRIIVMLVKILVLIYHLCGFSSNILKFHELLTICNLYHQTEGGNKLLALSGGSALLRRFVSSRVFWIL